MICYSPLRTTLEARVHISLQEDILSADDLLFSIRNYSRVNISLQVDLPLQKICYSPLGTALELTFHY